MKRKLIWAVVWFSVSCAMPAWATPPIDEPVDLPPAVLNDPTQTVSIVKEVINKIQPSYETVWDVYNGDFYQGVSGSLYTFTSRDIPIASLRLGASTGMSIYGGVSLDVPGITKRLVPGMIEEKATLSPLDTVWSFVGKYARVGVVGGYSWDHEDPVLGVTAGAAVTF